MAAKDEKKIRNKTSMKRNTECIVRDAKRSQKGTKNIHYSRREQLTVSCCTHEGKHEGEKDTGIKRATRRGKEREKNGTKKKEEIREKREKRKSYSKR